MRKNFPQKRSWCFCHLLYRVRGFVNGEWRSFWQEVMTQSVSVLSLSNLCSLSSDKLHDSCGVRFKTLLQPKYAVKSQRLMFMKFPHFSTVFSTVFKNRFNCVKWIRKTFVKPKNMLCFSTVFDKGMTTHYDKIPHKPWNRRCQSVCCESIL